MGMTQENKEIREMMEKESPKNIVVSFLLAMVFGVAAAVAAMAFRETFEDIALKIIIGASSDLEASQTIGFRRLSQISAIVIMLGGWMTAFMVVWSKLEKRKVELGEYNMMADLQEITKGLTAEDHIAFPDETLCAEGAPTTREQPVIEAPAGDMGSPDTGIAVDDAVMAVN